MSKTLTPNSRLDSLKKEAKAWLKAIRTGDASARARLTAAWPKAPAEPGLRDMQHALALDHGQESWAVLKTALDELTVSRLSHAARVDAVLRHGWDGDLATARRILKRHPEVAKDSLFTAATCGDVEEVRRRLARDPKTAKNSGGSRQWTALAYVAYSRLDEVNAVEIARLLLDHGADPNFGFDDGWGSPFRILTGVIGQGEGVKPSHSQAEGLAKVLIEAGADPFDPQALYNTSIVSDDIHWTERLWRRSETLGGTDRWRQPAPGLMGGRNIRALDYLLGNAVGANHPKRADWLLDHGADANAIHGYTQQPVLALARLSGFGEIAALLERYGAKPVSLEGLRAFQAACLAGDEYRARQLAASDPALLGQAGPLLAAAGFGNAKAVALMLLLGVDHTAADSDGITPLHRAVQSGSLETVDGLLAAGADPDRREDKWKGTALSWAMVLAKPHLVERLAPISRDVRAFASLGRLERLEELLTEEPELANHLLEIEDWPTPLYCLPDDEAAAIDVARVLLRHGADPATKNSQGQTPADVAEARGLDEAADLIAAAKP